MYQTTISNLRQIFGNAVCDEHDELIARRVGVAAARLPISLKQAERLGKGRRGIGDAVRLDIAHGFLERVDILRSGLD